MSSGRSRRDDRKRGGAGGGAGGGGGGGGGGGRNRYRYVSIMFLMNFQWNHKQIYEHKIHLSFEPNWFHSSMYSFDRSKHKFLFVFSHSNIVFFAVSVLENMYHMQINANCTDRK